jgi:hypothetical protein
MLNISINRINLIKVLIIFLSYTFLNTYSATAGYYNQTDSVVTVQSDTNSADFQANPGFLDNPRNEGPPSFNFIFILALMFLIMVILDLVYFKFIKSKFIHNILILILVYVIGDIIVTEAITLGSAIGYEPDQPVKFSHKVHAGDNKTECLYCHHGANDSKYALIPSSNVCMNCHTVLIKGRNTGEAEISKIYKSIETGEPIKWIKVHNLPDHVFFSHAQHVNAGKIDCVECHGEVEKMGRIQQVHKLSMGWCLDCHKTTQVQFKTNAYYNNYKQLQEDFNSGKIDKVTARDIGANDCQKCHY